MVHLVPAAIFPTPAKFNFNLSRLLSLLKRNPKYWPSVGSVFLVVPTFAAITVFHKFQSPDVILTKANCEPWQKLQDYEHPRPKF